MGPDGREIADSIPEDVAALYAWAKLTGAKYRDYSAERRERRAQMRYRAAKELLQRELAAQAEAGAQGDEASRRIETARRAEDAARAALLAIAEEREIAEARASARRKREVFEQAEKVRRERTGPQPHAADTTTGPRAAKTPEEDRGTEDAAIDEQGEDTAPKEAATPAAPASIEAGAPLRPAWLETSADFAWPEEAGAAPPIATRRTATAVGVTLFDSREQVAFRWPVLQMLVEHLKAQSQVSLGRMSWSRGPVIAILSPTGGAGKTSLAAALAGLLARSGERVLLIESATDDLLPLYFGREPARDSKAGDAEPGSVSLMRLNGCAAEREQEAGVEAMLAKAQGCDRIILDLDAEALWVVRQVTALRPLALAVITPDMNSVAGIPAVEQSFAGFADQEGRALLPFYVLNQFDARLPLHLDIREVLGRHFGRRLASVAVRRSPAISEALAEGTSVLEYAPDSPVARDIGDLASWLASVAPASAEAIAVAGAARGVR